ncbi:MAG: flippase [Bacteroidia bacterium]|nr:flippase [Bacteroidia bacterium]
MASVKRNFAFNVLLVISNIVFPVVIFPYIARILGPQGLGNAHFALQFSKYFMITASLGIPIYGLREVAKVKDDVAKRSKLVSELLVLNFITALLSTLVYFCVIYYSTNLIEYKAYLIVAALQVITGFLSIDWLFYGLEDFKTITIRSLVVRIVTIGFLIGFIQTPDDVMPYLVISILSITAAHIWNLFYAFKQIRFQLSNLAILPHLKPIFIIFLMNVCITMYTVFDTVWVGFLSSAAAVGLYTSAMKLCKISIPLVSALGIVLQPKSAQKFAANETQPAHLQTSFNFIIDMAIPIAFGLCILAPEFLMLLSGKAFLEATLAMRILSILPLCIGLNNLFGMQILSASGHDKNLLFSVFCGMILHVILNIWLVPIYEHVGAAIAIASTEIFVTAITYLFVFIRFKITFSISRVIRTVLISLGFIPIIEGLRYLHPDPALFLLLCIFVCFNYYLWIQWIAFKNEFIASGISVLKNKISLL